MEFKMSEAGFYSEFPYGRLDVSGDESQGFRPYQLLISSVAVCSGGVLRNILKKMRIEFEDIQIEVDAQRREKEPKIVEKISLHYKIKGQDLDEKKVGKAIDITEKNCSMLQSVIDSIQIEKSFEIIK